MITTANLLSKQLATTHCLPITPPPPQPLNYSLRTLEAEEKTERTMAKASPDRKGGEASAAAGNPFEFRVCGPRNLSSPSWRDLISSNWKNPNYKRMVIACFIQAVYLLELDRQEKRNGQNGLAPQWWKSFKYKLAQTLVDERDGSIYGAIFEWDRYAALSDYIPIRPSGAPGAVMALRGTLLTTPTFRRDIEDDLRFLAWESLKGSVRFAGALEALRTAVRKIGSSNVCLGGHSLGAGFALQVGKALAKEGMFIECHVFNPPSVSVAMSLRSFGEMAGQLWSRVRARLPYRGDAAVTDEAKAADEGGNNNKWRAEMNKWMPHLYINTNDYICCYYNDAAGIAVATNVGSDKAGSTARRGDVVAKMFIMSRGPSKFLQAHGLQQWWADDVELQLALNHSKLINRQLRSLYAAHPSPNSSQ